VRTVAVAVPSQRAVSFKTPSFRPALLRDGPEAASDAGVAGVAEAAGTTLAVAATTSAQAIDAVRRHTCGLLRNFVVSEVS
jgi:hypothetical protein